MKAYRSELTEGGGEGGGVCSMQGTSHKEGQRCEWNFVRYERIKSDIFTGFRCSILVDRENQSLC